MIKQSIIIATRDLVNTAVYANTTIKPKDGTPLAILNRAATQIATIDTDTASPVDATGALELGVGAGLTPREQSLYNASIRLDAGGVERHSFELGDIAKTFSEMLSNSIKYARSVVNPLVRDIVEKSEKAIEMDVSRLTTKVMVLDQDPIYSNGVLETLVDRGLVKSSTAKPLPVSYKERIAQDITPEYFLKVCAINNSGFDEAAKTLFDILPDYVRSSLMNGTYLTTETNPITQLKPYTDHFPLFCYLFLNGVKNGNHASVGELSPQERLDINNALDYFSYLLNYQFDACIAAAKYNLIINVAETRGGSGEVCVNGPVYRTWIEQKQGSQEAVIGFALIVGNNVVSMEQNKDLYENPAIYLRRYERENRTNISISRARACKSVDGIIRSAIYTHLLEEYKDDVNVRREKQALLEKTIEANPYAHTAQLDLHALRVVCTVLCMQNNVAYEILTTMREYLNDNPKANNTEAALVAASKIVARWATSQFMYIKN